MMELERTLGVLRMVNQMMQTYQPKRNYARGENETLPLEIEDTAVLPALKEQIEDLKSDRHWARIVRISGLGTYLVFRHPLMAGGINLAMDVDLVERKLALGTFQFPDEMFATRKTFCREFRIYPEAVFHLNEIGFERPRSRSKGKIDGLREIRVIYGAEDWGRWTFISHPGFLPTLGHCFIMSEPATNAGRGFGYRRFYPYRYSHVLIRYELSPEYAEFLRQRPDDFLAPEGVEIVGQSSDLSWIYGIKKMPVETDYYLG